METIVRQLTKIGIKMRRSENALITIATLVCFLVAIDRLHKFYYENAPVAQEGECLEGDKIGFEKMQVIKNEEGFAIVSVNGERMTAVSYEELRDAEVKKVDCK